MKLSTRVTYGIRAILELALVSGDRPLRSKDLADRQEIPIKYLEQLMSILKSAGLVKSIRGPKGGYKLSRSASQIRLDEVFCALEGPVEMVECLGDESVCERYGDCVVREFWSDVENAVVGALESYMLQDLVDKAEKKKSTVNFQI